MRNNEIKLQIAICDDETFFLDKIKKSQNNILLKKK